MPDVYDAADVLAVYTRDVARYPVMTREEEAEVGRRAMAGDEEAQQALVRANLRFVINIAKRYQHHGVPLMDLIQAGNIGLAHAARKFDPRMGNRFISYAIHWICQSIQKEIDNNAGAIRPTQTQMVRVRRVRRLQALARQQLGRELTEEEIRQETGFTLARINEALEYKPSIQSLDAPIKATEGTTTTLAQIISYDDGREEREDEAALRQAMAKVLAEVLSPREREIIEEYFGFGNRRELSLTEIGAARGISRERARQLKERALRKLRRAKQHHPLLLEHFAVTKKPSAVKQAESGDSANGVAPPSGNAGKPRGKRRAPTPVPAAEEVNDVAPTFTAGAQMEIWES